MLLSSPTGRGGDQPIASRWTRPLQNLTVVCSLIFVIGTTLQTFLIIDLPTMDAMMRLAGASPAQAHEQAPGFLTGFRAVGCVYIVANAVGLLARTGRRSVFWIVLLVNATQAAGLLIIPPEVFEVTRSEHGLVGLLPSLVTDGGAAVLTLVLAGFLISYRQPWARQRPRTAA
jgi:hypothetical protein